MTQDNTEHRILSITVRGLLSDRIAAGFEGMRIARRGGTTELVGELVDQAHLHGLLTRVRDLGLDLESALVIDCPAPMPAAESTSVHRTPTDRNQE